MPLVWIFQKSLIAAAILWVTPDNPLKNRAGGKQLLIPSLIIIATAFFPGGYAAHSALNHTPENQGEGKIQPHELINLIHHKGLNILVIAADHPWTLLHFRQDISFKNIIGAFFPIGLVLESV